MSTEKPLEIWLAETLDEPATSNDLARTAYRSRSQLYRWLRAVAQETPQAMRRRLQLERAAWQLTNSQARITDIAFGAGYQSLEAFTRAFTRAYGASPSHYRRLRPSRTELPAPNGIHFLKLSRLSNQPTGELSMTLYERFAGTESWHTNALLDYAAQLNDEQLDRPLPSVTEAVPFYEPTKTVRQLLENIVYTKEVWAAAILGKKDMDMNPTPASERTPTRLKERLKQADANFHQAFSQIAAEGRWDEEFVDALCEPPERFTYGGVFADIITFNAHRRLQALDALRQLGVITKGYGDPIEYERAMAAKLTV